MKLRWKNGFARLTIIHKVNKEDVLTATAHLMVTRNRKPTIWQIYKTMRDAFEFFGNDSRLQYTQDAHEYLGENSEKIEAYVDKLFGNRFSE